MINVNKLKFVLATFAQFISLGYIVLIPIWTTIWLLIPIFRKHLRLGHFLSPVEVAPWIGIIFALVSTGIITMYLSKTKSRKNDPNRFARVFNSTFTLPISDHERIISLLKNQRYTDIKVQTADGRIEILAIHPRLPFHPADQRELSATHKSGMLAPRNIRIVLKNDGSGVVYLWPLTWCEYGDFTESSHYLLTEFLKEIRTV